MRVSHALLLMYLHIGNDPPDYPRLEPYAKYECWIDPMVAQFAPYTPQQARGGSDGIAEALEVQYRTAVLRGKDVGFLRVIEGNVESARAALVKARRLAHGNRVLVHYNGHGMPQATMLGEVWMFSRDRTHYVPLNILDMAELVHSPTVYVIDCNAAGWVLQRWYAERQHEQLQELRAHDLFICACAANEMLPLSPALPADLLTSCLTTPLKMALEWYIGFSQLKILLPHVTDDMIRSLPGDITDPCTPQGDLQLVLTAVTETVAWCAMEPAQFQYLLRQDGSTAALFRNAVLADWLIRAIGCTPVMHPPLSEEAHVHPIWELWVYTVERTVSQLPALLSPETPQGYVTSSFFSDQLTAFEVWIDSGDLSELPEQLPSVLLALSLPQHQLRIFTLLVKYLDASRVAGQRTIRCGVLPYMGRFMAQRPELFLVITVLWMQLIRADPAAGCAEMQRCQGERYFIGLLKLDERATPTTAVEYGQAGGHALRPGACAPPVSPPRGPRPRPRHPRREGRNSRSEGTRHSCRKKILKGDAPSTSPSEIP
ncbi:hypothetical protein STCU_08185 [Strigomonas culicis]|uniref:Raptor N-terminal CASPase-like domain-containing protein n=1 Tax=Strigomonas culicis TaxID=28005 RepID=S9U188_9TRYP|nr:hypothetical protein STCU_08185 [Strigomonas culicis]|eukprot:EPY22663.1 hypothetical protein STCU_08185 [Strigomonas culicis]